MAFLLWVAASRCEGVTDGFVTLPPNLIPVMTLQETVFPVQSRHGQVRLLSPDADEVLVVKDFRHRIHVVFVPLPFSRWPRWSRHLARRGRVP